MNYCDENFFSNFTPIPTPSDNDMISTHIEAVDIPYDYSLYPSRAYTNSFYVPLPDPKHKTSVVIDLDETLVYARDGPLMIRPYSKLLLSLLRETFDDLEIIIWSAGTVEHVDRCLHALDPNEDLVHHAIGRYRTDDMIEASKKNLKELVGRNGRCIIVDNSPMASIHNGSSAIIVPDFDPYHEKSHLDTILLFVLQIVARAHILYTLPNNFYQEELEDSIFDIIGYKNGIHNYILDNPFISTNKFNDIIYYMIDGKYIDSVVNKYGDGN